MAQLSPDVTQAIEQAVSKFRAALVRMYTDEDVGSITADVGVDKIDIKANPVRKEKSVMIDRGHLATTGKR